MTPKDCHQLIDPYRLDVYCIYVYMQVSARSMKHAFFWRHQGRRRCMKSKMESELWSSA